MILSRPLGWFWLLAIVLLAWNVIGLVALLFDPVLGLGDVSKLASEQPRRSGWCCRTPGCSLTLRGWMPAYSASRRWSPDRSCWKSG